MADQTSITGRSGSIRLKYDPSGVTKCLGPVNFRLATLDRPYMGLTQACRLLRQEFRPLYPRIFPVHHGIRYYGEYLLAFGLNETVQAMGKLITTASLDTLPQHYGYDIFAFFNVVHDSNVQLPPHNG
jgi:hypothetical protein